MADFNQNKSETLYFPERFFKENSVYYFSINYQNFLGIESSSDVILKFGSAKANTVFLDIDHNSIYYAYKEIIIPVKITSLDCSGNMTVDTKAAISVKVEVLD